MAEASATPTLAFASCSAWNRLVVGDAPLADTSSPAPGGCWISGFYPFHPVALTEPEPTGGCQPLLPVFPVRFASEPSPFPGYVPNSRPASALELKRRPFPDLPVSSAEAATPACHVHPSGRSFPGGGAVDPKVSAARKSRRCGDLPPAPSGPPGTAMTSRRWPRLSRGCLACRSHQRQCPKTRLPGTNHPLGTGSPEAVYVCGTVTRPVAPNGPAQTVLPRTGAPKSQHRLPT